MTRATELAKQAGLPARAWKREIEAFYTLARADYETNLSAVMPADFKDWHENSRSEWPELAAWVITSLREQRADLEAENEKLREALYNISLCSQNSMSRQRQCGELVSRSTERNEMTDEEINRITFEQWGPVIDVPPAAHRAFARAIIAAHTAKLLAGVEMPKPVAFSHEGELDYINNHAGRAGEILPFKHNPDLLNDDEFLHIYTADQLQAYAAAAALNARNKALEEALNCYSPDDSATDWFNKIEALKGKV